jgi:hypothetical protein
MRGDVHVRFGERPGETGRPKGRHRAPGRLDDHTALVGRVRHRIGDKRVLGLVKAFLKAGVLSEGGVMRDTITGTPQGGILSPLLANIALSGCGCCGDPPGEAQGPGESAVAKPTDPPEPLWRPTLRACAPCSSACPT